MLFFVVVAKSFGQKVCSLYVPSPSSAELDVVGLLVCWFRSRSSALFTR